MPVPDNLEPIWRLLYDEARYVFWQWHLFRQLFLTSAERLELLNECAADFFGNLQIVMARDVALTLGKLNDKSRVAGRRTAALAALVEFIRAAEGDGPSVDELGEKLSRYAAACAPIKALRNEYLAHFDSKLAGGGLLKPLDIRSIEEALNCLADLMNAVAMHYGLGKTSFSQQLRTHDAESLVIWLKRGLLYRDLEQMGKIRPGRGLSHAPGGLKHK